MRVDGTFRVWSSYLMSLFACLGFSGVDASKH